MSLGMELGFGPGDFVLDVATQLPPPQEKGTTLQFSAYVYCGETAGCIRKLLGTEVGLGPGDIVSDGETLPQKGHSPQFLALVYCSQTVAHLLLRSYCKSSVQKK